MKLRPLFGRYGVEGGHHRFFVISAFDPEPTLPTFCPGALSKTLVGVRELFVAHPDFTDDIEICPVGLFEGSWCFRISRKTLSSFNFA
jgi:hypothetical protein